MARHHVALRDEIPLDEVGTHQVDLDEVVYDDEFSAEVYSWVLRRPSASAAEIEAALGAPYHRVDGALRHLEALRLISFLDDDRRRLIAVGPSAAHLELVAPLEQEIHDRRLTLTGIQGRLRRFGDVFDRVRRAELHTEPSFTTHDSTQTRLRLADAVSHCTDEALLMQSGESPDDHPLRLVEPFLATLLRRGVGVRAVVPHTVRAHAQARKLLSGLADAGAHVRTCNAPPQNLLVLDRGTAFAFTADSREVTVLYDAAAVGVLGGLHAYAWESATDFEPCVVGYGETFGAVQSAILRLLAAGHKDEFIAHRLGISARTLRRHIAVIMDSLGAQSRFQAGVLAAHAGLLQRTHQTPEG
ncbi:helix-turn-helix transcriptional regulator [Streptomyces sp. NPDC047072]|uniref:helix-turn-helix transcriptional regulator n=1 Tax=Streptomyces sp. NPDC047072 TaxID=3154809 RepID=UPI00340284BE